MMADVEVGEGDGGVKRRVDKWISHSFSIDSIR